MEMESRWLKPCYSFRAHMRIFRDDLQVSVGLNCMTVYLLCTFLVGFE